MRAAAVKATEETIRHAARFGARAVVMHLGSVGPYGVSRKLETIYARGGFLSRSYTDIKVPGRPQAAGSIQGGLAEGQGVPGSAGRSGRGN